MRRYSQNLARDLAKQVHEKGEDAVCAMLEQCIEDGDIKPAEFSIRELAEELVEDGHEWVQTLDPRRRGRHHLMEADAVKTTAFANITGQIVYSTVMQAFADEQFVFSAIVPTQQTQLSGEKIPGITGLGDVMEAVGEAQDYPVLTVGQDWITTPETVKRGGIVPVTREAIFFDRTGLLTQQASAVGHWMGYNKEVRIIDCIIDENTTAHRYVRRDIAMGATYGDNSGDHDFDNLSASTSLVDWTDIEAVELLLAAITDPNTGAPVIVQGKHVVVTPQLVHTAKYIFTATQIAVQAGGFATSGNLWRTNAPNVLDNYQILSSRLLAQRMATDTSWFLGDVAMAFKYMENWGIETTTSDRMSDDAFKRDIVVAYKVSERGAAATVEPRAIAKATA